MSVGDVSWGDTLTVSSDTLTCGKLRIDADGYVYTWRSPKESKPRMYVYDVVAVNRRTFQVQTQAPVVAANRDKALIKAAQGMPGNEIDDWHIEVKQLFSFEPIGADK